jgi:hypothetical protein
VTDDEQPDDQPVPARRVGSGCIQTTGGAWIDSPLVHAEPRDMPAEVEITKHRSSARITHSLDENGIDIQVGVDLTQMQAREVAQTLLKIADEMEVDR